MYDVFWERILRSASGDMADDPQWLIEVGTQFDHFMLAFVLLLDPHPPLRARVAAATLVSSDVSAGHVLRTALGVASKRDDHASFAFDLCAGADLTPDEAHDAALFALERGLPGSVVEVIGWRGWGMLDRDLRRRALDRWGGSPSCGAVWAEMTHDERELAAAMLAPRRGRTAELIGRMGGEGWRRTDPDLRKRLLDRALSDEAGWSMMADAFVGMTPAERDRVVDACAQCAEDAANMLDALGRDRVVTLSSRQRERLDASARRRVAWRTLLLRIADAGWNGVSQDDRSVAVRQAERHPWFAADVVRAIGAERWQETDPFVRRRLRMTLRDHPLMILRTPPPLWTEWGAPESLPLHEARNPVMRGWNVDGDLTNLPPAIQTTALAMADWLVSDRDRWHVRARRLATAWRAMSFEEQQAVAAARPTAPVIAAAAARLSADDACTESLIPLLAWMVQDDHSFLSRTVALLVRRFRTWRPWMKALRPAQDSPDRVQRRWRAIVRQGLVPDRGVCLEVASLRCPPRQHAR